MEIVVSCRVKVHETARARFTEWARRLRHSFGPLKAELESTQGRPGGAVRVGKGRWIWSVGGTFVCYTIIDKPIAISVTGVRLPFLVNRRVVITDIFIV